jgi:hypothetical protein
VASVCYALVVLAVYLFCLPEFDCICREIVVAAGGQRM